MNEFITEWTPAVMRLARVLYEQHCAKNNIDTAWASLSEDAKDVWRSRACFRGS